MTVIKFNEVSFHYPNQRELILDKLSFDILENSTTVILGKNGSGKTTLLKLLMGFEKPTMGEIFLSGRLLTEYTIKEKSQEIAYVGQDVFSQFDFKVEDYLLFGLTNSLGMFHSPKEEHYRKVNDYVERFTIKHLINKKMDQLSGGEKQIVMICKAFIQESKIIVLDEPLSALDFTNQNKVLKLLKEIKKENKTFILTTHNPNHALYLDADVLLLNNKVLVLQGNARNELKIDKLKEVYGETIGFSMELSYKEFSIRNDDI